MVKQTEQVKNSSIQKPLDRSSTVRKSSQYRFSCHIETFSFVPETTEVVLVQDLGPATGIEGVPGFIISGCVLDQIATWPEPPHLAFANLLAETPEAVETFTKRYGVLSQLYMDREDPDGKKFSIDSATFSGKQDLLRVAWCWMAATKEEDHPPEGGSAVMEIEGQVEESFKADVIVTYRSVSLRARDLWASICFLFLWDAMAGKLGFCDNPDCAAPCFLKKRKTQKYCEAGPCVVYAQRQYSLDWWNRVGKKRREKKTKTKTRMQGRKV